MSGEELPNTTCSHHKAAGFWGPGLEKQCGIKPDLPICPITPCHGPWPRPDGEKVPVTASDTNL